MVSLAGLKLCMALAIFVVNLASGLMTLWAIKKARAKAKTVELTANAVTAGLFLGIVVLLLLPELPIAEEEVRQAHHLTYRFSITSFSTVIGIILMIILDASIRLWKQHSLEIEIGSEMIDNSSALSPVPLLPTTPSTESLQKNLFKFVLFTTLMSLHSFFEGLPLGYKNTVADVTAFSVPMLIHKALEAVTVASAGQKEKKRHVALGCLLHSFMTPTGALIGCLVNGDGDNFSKDLALLVIMGLSVGTMLYITFIEVLAPLLSGSEFTGTSDFVKIAGIVVGFATTFLVSLGIGALEHSTV